jgi:stearoyl-CoA desaturase (delta-9 desaturase)
MFWWMLAYVLMTGHLVVASTTLYLHRSETHGALTLHAVLAHPARFFLWFLTGTVTKEWVAIHRWHHDTVDTADDPHSPKVLGIGRVFFLGAFLYKTAAKNKRKIDFYGRGTPNDWLERHVYTPHSALGIVLLLPALNYWLFGWWGFLAWGVQMIWIPFWGAGFVNGFGHFIGTRNFDTPDASHNIVPCWFEPAFSFFTCGEEWHNNHHAFPTAAKLSFRKEEFDLGWLYIRIFEMLGLATNVRHVQRTPYRLLA